MIHIVRMCRDLNKTAHKIGVGTGQQRDETLTFTYLELIGSAQTCF